MEKYVTIGTKEISKDVFRKVIRPNRKNFYKPNGGLWASKYVDSKYCISQWHDYLIYENKSAAFFKNINEGAIITLKEDARILTIDTQEKVTFLAAKYPSYEEPNQKDIIDYEALSQDYDGIEVIINKLESEIKYKRFRAWSVDTLLLFNLDCIKEYQSIDIHATIDNDEEYPYITNISSPKKVIEYTEYYQEIYNYIKELFNQLITNITYTNYDKYNEEITNIITKISQIALQEKDETITKIINQLKHNNIKIKKEDLIYDIAYNYLATYFIENKEKEKTIVKKLAK